MMKLFARIGARVGLSATGVAIVAAALVACGGGIGVGVAGLRGDQVIASEKNVSNNALGRIKAQEPLPVLNDSSDAHNQRIFYTEQSDPSKVEYLELIGLSGQPYAHFTIKGQVSSMNTQMSNPSQAVCSDGGTNGNACTTIGLPEPNGVYLGQDAGHFAITTSGALVEWEGNFVTSDQPFSIKAPVSMTLNENVAPTVTSLSHVSGGVLPNGRAR